MADSVTRNVEYKHGEVVLEGYVAYDGAVKGKRPGVLVVHEWWGITDFTRERCQALAREGYVAFAVDLYGKGVRTTQREEAARLSGQFKDDPVLLRARVRAGLDALLADEQCDPKRVAAVGYCFGGTAVLHLAFSGADIAGVVSYHGVLATDVPVKPGSIKSKIRVFTGEADPGNGHSSIAARGFTARADIGAAPHFSVTPASVDAAG